MLKTLKSNERGVADHGWLHSHHSFSFANYYNPDEMGFSALRVINEDVVQPAKGFGTHGHQDMEIITYVLSGALEHKDSMGNGSVIHHGSVQRMSAGTGVTHSEFNHSGSELVHFLQIWIEPNVTGIQPSYEEKVFDEDSKRKQLRLIASHDGRDGSVLIHQHAAVYAAILNKGEKIEYALNEGRSAYVHVVKGDVTISGIALTGGDALKVIDENNITLMGVGDNAEILLFDLP